MLDTITKFFGFFFSNFRGSVPTPNINSPRYFTALEVQKDFELCEDYFKTAFRPYPEKRWVEFFWMELAVFCWLVKIDHQPYTFSPGPRAIWKETFPLNDIKPVAIVTNWQLTGSVIGCLYKSPSFGFYSWITELEMGECLVKGWRASL